MLEYRIEEEGPVYTELWLLDDRPHREDGPACIMRRTADGAVGFELWYREGRLHRHDGPAALHYDFESGRVTEAHYFQDGAPARDGRWPRKPRIRSANRASSKRRMDSRSTRRKPDAHALALADARPRRRRPA